MAVRLQMKLGLVAEPERLEDSPDTVAIVEPTIGATARSKGSLFLVVTGVGRARRLREATHLAAETIQAEYYYDESAGLVVCLEKAIRAANRRLLAQRERLGLGTGPTGPIGIGLAVVRGNELYVVTTGPAEAYLVRQAHLLTLPDAARANGLPMDEVTLEVWRGEIAVRDSLVLVSSNLTAKLGPDELKDAVVTLHPQAAMEHLHHRFVAAGGAGSDAALALEAGEVSATTHRGRLVPVRPPEPLAGLPDRSPIPLADSVGGGLAAVSSGAGRARAAVRNGLAGSFDRLQDLLPRRGTRYRRVTPAATRRESQRRAAYAVLAFVGVVALLGVGLWVVGGSGATTKIPAITAGEQALATARDDVRFVFDNGTDLIAADPKRAEQLLKDAIAQVGTAAQAGIPASTLDPVRLRATAGLDRLYGVVEVAPETAFSFASQQPAFDLGGLVQGPDGAPYVLDRTTRAVYRISLQSHKAVPIMKAGQVVASAGIKVGVPRYLAVGGPDLLMLDDKNILWRWRPADDTGKGTLRRLPVQESATWGNDIMAIGTFVANFNAALYNLYVMDPSEQQILRYTMLADGSSYPAAATGYLTTAAGCLEGDVDVHRRRGLPRGRGPGRALRERPVGRLVARVARRRRAPADAAVHAHRLTGPPPPGHVVRVRRRQRTGAGVRQAHRELPGAVPAGRGQPRMDRPAGVLRRAPLARPGARDLLDRRDDARNGDPPAGSGDGIGRVARGQPAPGRLGERAGLGGPGRHAEGHPIEATDGDAAALAQPVGTGPGAAR